MKGRIFYVDSNHIMRANGNQLFNSTDGGKHWVKVVKIKNVTLKEKFANYTHLLSRLFRYGIHHISSGERDYGLIVNKSYGVLREGVFEKIGNLESSRPLSLEYIDRQYVFGEYLSNPKRIPIRVQSFISKCKLSAVYSFHGIRHIHGVYKDPYTGFVWITTGDLDDEAAIYYTNDNFKTLEKVLFGSQQTRAIKILFTLDFIYFGSDAPEEVNYLYRLSKSTFIVERLQQVGSSVFHGCIVNNWLFFSTAVEPSSVNLTKFAEVWASPNGINWKCIFKFKKDSLPIKYFQYGQVFFPSGPGDNQNLWLSLFATEKSNQSIRISLVDIKKEFDR